MERSAETPNGCAAALGAVREHCALALHDSPADDRESSAKRVCVDPSVCRNEMKTNEDASHTVATEDGNQADDEVYDMAVDKSGHPVGIQPLGNLYFAEPRLKPQYSALANEPGADLGDESKFTPDMFEEISCREPGLGPCFAQLEDATIVEKFLRMLDGPTLVRLAQASRAWYGFVYGSDVEVWKPLVIAMFKGDFTFQYTWRRTFAYEYVRKRIPGMSEERANQLVPALNAPPVKLAPFRLFNFYSDYLHQPWFCATGIMANLELWDREQNIAREDARKLTVEEFRQKYEIPCKPVVLEHIIEAWDAWKDKLWTPEYLRKPVPEGGFCGDVQFSCGAVDMTMDKYLTYAERVSLEESPLYLFDKRFGEKCPELLKHYKVPDYFQRDFYSWVPPRLTPAFRWWLIGPAKSGSSFHKDPLYTHAWNGLLVGKKKWILYPPHILPPGVYASADHLEVAAPLSVAEWYLNFYHETQVKPNKRKNNPSPKGLEDYDHIIDWPRKCSTYEDYSPVEVIQKPGDLLFIPSQWWHTALNFEFSVAVTQNILSDSNYVDGMNFLTKIRRNELRQAVEDELKRREPGRHEELLAEAQKYSLRARLQALAASGEIDESKRKAAERAAQLAEQSRRLAAMFHNKSRRVQQPTSNFTLCDEEDAHDYGNAANECNVGEGDSRSKDCAAAAAPTEIAAKEHTESMPFTFEFDLGGDESDD